MNKAMLLKAVLVVVLSLAAFLASCGSPGSVSVGVGFGVGMPAPWIGPYGGGGTVRVGGPVGRVY